jgi:DNA polymerase/3'-5' exonuclease PolX
MISASICHDKVAQPKLWNSENGVFKEQAVSIKNGHEKKIFIKLGLSFS